MKRYSNSDKSIASGFVNSMLEKVEKDRTNSETVARNYAKSMQERSELRGNGAISFRERQFINSSKKLGYTISREGDEILASPPGTPGYKKPLLDLNPINIGKSIVKGVRTIGNALTSDSKLTRNKKRIIKRY